MPNYKSSHTLPVTLHHVAKVLSKIRPEEWKHVQNAAKHALKHGGLDEMIKPSSLKTIATSSPHSLISKISKEHREAANFRSETHLGGGLHHAVKTLFKTVWNLLGGNTITRLFKKNKKQRKLGKEQIDAARLVSASYKKDRPDNVGDWKRMDAYDSEYGSFWQKGDDYFLSVRGTKLRFKDLWKDGKLMLGSESQHNEKLEDSIDRFIKEHPSAKFDVAGHSLGTELAMNYLNTIGFNNVDDIYLFNPASSPAQGKDHVMQNINNSKVELFLNSNDPVSNFYSQNIDHEKNVYWGEFSANPISSHSLAQWIGDDTESKTSQEKSETSDSKVLVV